MARKAARSGASDLVDGKEGNKGNARVIWQQSLWRQERQRSKSEGNVGRSGDLVVVVVVVVGGGGFEPIRADSSPGTSTLKAIETVVHLLGTPWSRLSSRY
jgi:hypothetical protein